MKIKMKKGLHIIANFFGCSKNQELLTNKIKLERILEKIVKNNKLNILKKSFYKFKDGGGITGFILISESHFSIHTWPERNNYISFDIFVCNYNENNSLKAKKVFNEMINLLKPKKIQKKMIKRY